MPEVTPATTPDAPQASSGSRAWLAHSLEEGLRLEVLTPSQLLLHATPEVLAEKLPRELMVKVFASAFSTGKLTPEGILAVAPPATLVEYLPAKVLWSALRATDAGKSRELAADGPAPPKGATPLRKWIAQSIDAALGRGVLTPADVARHLPPASWVADVPHEVVARLIGLGLSQPRWNADLMLQVLDPRVIAEHVSPRLTWGIVDEAAARAFQLEGVPPA